MYVCIYIYIYIYTIDKVQLDAASSCGQKAAGQLPRMQSTAFSSHYYVSSYYYICVLIMLYVLPKEQNEAAACRKPLAANHICEVQLILRDFASVCERVSPLPLPLSPLPSIPPYPSPSLPPSLPSPSSFLPLLPPSPHPLSHYIQ